MKLYEIDEAIEACVDAETGEILDIEKLEQLEMERNKKIENVVLWHENLSADIEAFKEQEEFFEVRRKQAEKKIESLENYIAYALNGMAFETTRAKVIFRKSKSVRVDETKLPCDYWRITETRKPDLKAVGEALKAGKSVDGAWIEETLNPQINKARSVKNNA